MSMHAHAPLRHCHAYYAKRAQTSHCYYCVADEKLGVAARMLFTNVIFVLAFLLSTPVAVFMFIVLLLQAKLARPPTVNIVVHVHCTCGAAVPGAEQMRRQEEMNDEHYEPAGAAEWEIPVQETQYQNTRSRMVV